MFRYSVKKAVVLATIFLSGDALQAQPKSLRTDENFAEFLTFVRTLQQVDCIEDVPAPLLQGEPRYTQGNTNQLGFFLPPVGLLPVPVDSVREPFVSTIVRDLSTNAVFEFPRPVDLDDTSAQVEFIGQLENGVKYEFSSALVLPVCLGDCAAVTDSTQLEKHCSAYSDTVWTIQDNQVPGVTNVEIPELAASAFPGWLRQPGFTLRADLQDDAGVWQAFLYRKDCSEPLWATSVADTTFASDSSDIGFTFDAAASVTFAQELPDGCYSFRVEAKDGTHTPASFFPNFELAGNGGQPLDGAAAQIQITIDTSPPSSVSLDCQQILNTVQLTWTASEDPAPGIGLAKYDIFRNGEAIATVGAGQTTFIDRFTANTSDLELAYQVQASDSLGNVQTVGGEQTCSFRAVPVLTMLSEPEFTAGTTNEVCWTRTRDVTTYSVFRAQDGDFESSVRVAVADTCHTFTDLIDGSSYAFWVEAVDVQQRTIRSDTVATIQDASAPTLPEFSIAGIIHLANQDWVNTRDIEVSVVARDALQGRLKAVRLTENDSPLFEQDLSANGREWSATIPVALLSSICGPINLSLEITDAAGNTTVADPLRIALDDKAPEQVGALTCSQIQGDNAIGLIWTPAADEADCSGLAVYRVVRDGVVIDSVNAGVLSYLDSFPADAPSREFSYRIVPVDSVGNARIQGPEETCSYTGIPHIELAELPEFTPGLSNSICWSISGALANMTVFRASSCDGAPLDSVVIATPAAQGCQPFADLQDGQSYCYWITGTDLHARTVRSNTVQSRQDDTPPVVESFEFPGGQRVNGQVWAFSRKLDLALSARDGAGGEIWNYVITENGSAGAIMPVSDSTARFNDIISYDIVTVADNAVPIELSVKVIDGAGHESSSLQLGFFLQQKPLPMFAFPNPFNPMQEKATIRVDNEDETEVSIYDFFGNLVRRLNAKITSYDFAWDGKNGNGEYVANGGYIVVGTRTNVRFKIGVVKKVL